MLLEKNGEITQKELRRSIPRQIDRKLRVPKEERGGLGLLKRK